ncbi:hypothetical protein [Paenibacillus sp. GCM10027626]|uniref:capping complex subunit for YIEGIA n=1 Tax=Paenibacillus sp. GCM10027626 TaxID=3273411 RepID=UPI00363CCBCC
MAKIVAIVTTDSAAVDGGAPIFIEKNAAQQEATAFLLEKILNAAVHDLKNGTYILVDHTSE